jgi:hypothetical protein
VTGRRKRSRPSSMAPTGPEQSELILYQAEDGLTRIQVRLYEGTVWLTQKQLAELYQVRVPTVSVHLRNIFAEGEVDPAATVRNYLTVRTEEIARLLGRSSTTPCRW